MSLWIQTKDAKGRKYIFTLGIPWMLLPLILALVIALAAYLLRQL